MPILKPTGPQETEKSQFLQSEWMEEQQAQKQSNSAAFVKAFPDEDLVQMRNPEYLLDESRFSLYTILRGLMACTRPLSEGSNTVTLEFDPGILERKLFNWWLEFYSDDHLEYDYDYYQVQIKRFAEYLADKFVMKEGRVEDLVMVLTNEEEGVPNVVERKDISSAFGSAGFTIQPTSRKVYEDTQAALALIPYFGINGAQSECNVIALVKRFFEDECSMDNVEESKSDGTAIVSLKKGGSVVSKADFFSDLAKETPLRNGFAPYEFDNLAEAQGTLRSELFPNSKAEQAFRDFFSSLIHVGVRSAIRGLQGERHPQIGYEEALKVAEKARENQKVRDYLVGEMTIEAPYVKAVNENGPEMVENNNKTVNAFTKELIEDLPLEIRKELGEKDLRFIVAALLSYHHDYPEYEIDPQVGIISTSTVKLLGRFVQGFVNVILKKYAKGLSTFTDLPEKPNMNFDKVLELDPQINEIFSRLSEGHRQEFKRIFENMIFKYILMKGVKDDDEEKRMYQRIPTTYYLFQEKVSKPENDEKVIVLTLEELFADENLWLFDEYPELHEMVIDSSIISLNHFYETGNLLDRSESNRGKSLFIEGRYGKTPNIVVKIDRNTGKIDFKQVDLRDQFVEHDPEIHKKSYGVARHGLHIMVEEVVAPGTLQVIGESIEAVCRRDNGKIPDQFQSKEDRYFALGRDVVLQSYERVRQPIEKAASHIKTNVRDVTEGVIERVKRLF